MMSSGFLSGTRFLQKGLFRPLCDISLRWRQSFRFDEFLPHRPLCLLPEVSIFWRTSFGFGFPYSNGLLKRIRALGLEIPVIAFISRLLHWALQPLDSLRLRISPNLPASLIWFCFATATCLSLLVNRVLAAESGRADSYDIRRVLAFAFVSCLSFLSVLVPCSS